MTPAPGSIVFFVQEGTILAAKVISADSETIEALSYLFGERRILKLKAEETFPKVEEAVFSARKSGVKNPEMDSLLDIVQYLRSH